MRHFRLWLEDRQTYTRPTRKTHPCISCPTITALVEGSICRNHHPPVLLLLLWFNMVFVAMSACLTNADAHHAYSFRSTSRPRFIFSVSLNEVSVLYEPSPTVSEMPPCRRNRIEADKVPQGILEHHHLSFQDISLPIASVKKRQPLPPFKDVLSKVRCPRTLKGMKPHCGQFYVRPDR